MNLELNIKEIKIIMHALEDAKIQIDKIFKFSKINQKLYPNCYYYYKEYIKMYDKLNKKFLGG